MPTHCVDCGAMGYSHRKWFVPAIERIDPLTQAIADAAHVTLEWSAAHPITSEWCLCRMEGVVR